MCCQVLTGKYNPFARAAAKGELPKSSPLHKAAAFDLDVLQKLAVAETTLVSWVEDVSTSLPEGWATAGLFTCWQNILFAVTLYPCRLISMSLWVGMTVVCRCAQAHCSISAACSAMPTRLALLPSASVAAAAAYGPSTAPQQEAGRSEPLDIPEDLAAPAYIKAPLTPSQRTAYRGRIGGKWKWSEALPELQYYYEAHGFGITAVNSTLKWAGGHIEPYEPPKSMLNPSGRCMVLHVVCALPVCHSNALRPVMSYNACLQVRRWSCLHAHVHGTCHDKFCKLVLGHPQLRSDCTGQIQLPIADNRAAKTVGANLCLDCLAAGRRANRRVSPADLVDLEVIRQNTTDFITNENSAVSLLSIGECVGPTLIWDWPKERDEEQEPQHGIRFVRLLASDVSQLHDVAHTLQQYPRVKFVVYCDSLTAGWGSGAHSVLHSILAGEKQCLPLLSLTDLLYVQKLLCVSVDAGCCHSQACLQSPFMCPLAITSLSED